MRFSSFCIFPSAFIVGAYVCVLAHLCACVSVCVEGGEGHAVGGDLGFTTQVSLKDQNVNTPSSLFVAFPGCKNDW